MRCVLLVLTIVSLGSGARAEQAVPFVLDALSFVSFGGVENHPIPVGGTITFRFDEPTGSVASFAIQPADVSIPTIPVGESSLTYTLKQPASGTVTAVGDGYRVEFSATIVASLSGPLGGGTFDYPMFFTTEYTSASDTGGSGGVAVDGMRLLAGSNAMQLVGATTNKSAAFPGPGKAVYTVVSGAFAESPALP